MDSHSDSCKYGAICAHFPVNSFPTSMKALLVTKGDASGVQVKGCGSPLKRALRALGEISVQSREILFRGGRKTGATLFLYAAMARDMETYRPDKGESVMFVFQSALRRVCDAALNAFFAIRNANSRANVAQHHFLGISSADSPVLPGCLAGATVFYYADDTIFRPCGWDEPDGTFAFPEARPDGRIAYDSAAHYLGIDRHQVVATRVARGLTKDAPTCALVPAPPSAAQSPADATMQEAEEQLTPQEAENPVSPGVIPLKYPHVGLPQGIARAAHAKANLAIFERAKIQPVSEETNEVMKAHADHALVLCTCWSPEDAADITPPGVRLLRAECAGPCMGGAEVDVSRF